jgi:hypothetical protein
MESLDPTWFGGFLRPSDEYTSAYKSGVLLNG